MKFTYLIFFLTVTVFRVASQDIDTLNLQLKTVKHDTIKVKIMLEMTEILYNTNPDTIIPICKSIIQIIDQNLVRANKQEKISFLATKAGALNNLAAVYGHQGKSQESLECFKQSLKTREQLNDKKGIAATLINMGATYNNLGDIHLALDNYMRSLKILEQIDDEMAMASLLNNIGYIYKKQGDNEKAVNYYQKSLKIRESINDLKGVAVSINNLGAIYKSEGENEKALSYYKRSLDISSKINYKVGMALSYNNIGTICFNVGNIEEAIDNFRKSLAIWEELKDREGMAYSLNFLANSLLEKNDISSAEPLAKKSLELAKEIGYPENIKNVSMTLSKIYTRSGNWKGAYDMQVLYKEMSDSISNEQIRKGSIQKEFQYEYEKKATADSIKAAGEREVLVIQMKQERNQRNLLYLGIGVIGVFSAFMYNRFRVTRKQKAIIELQKIEVDKQRELADSRRVIAEEQKYVIQVKQKEIIDSINYASRIQQAMLTSESYFNEHLKAEYFICYQPKDIVSGDFYWATEQHGRFYIATGDCTGHGVPGAFMSLLNISFLNENIIEKGMSDPSEILNQQRIKIIKALNPSGNENSKDGMDCVLCAFDLKTRSLEFAAANNPLWLIRDEQIVEFKPDKMSVGKGETNDKGFSRQSLALQKGDVIYTFTDGFADQFGGPRGKKFMYRQLGEVLLANHKSSMAAQKAALLESFNTWKGSHDQIDDVLVIGVRV